MSKTELLLSLAHRCVSWGEGSDFEMKEVIEEASKKIRDALKIHYSEFYIIPDGIGIKEDMDARANWMDEKGCHSSVFYTKVKSDICKILIELIKTGDIADLKNTA